MQQAVYVKDDSRPYRTTYRAVAAENVDEEFFTYEEVKEATDSRYFSEYVHQYHYAKIKRDLAKAAKSIPENKKSVVLDADLLWTVKKDYTYTISSYLQNNGWRINGKRLYNKPPEQKAVRIDDYNLLKSCACHILRQKGVDLQFLHTSRKDEVVRTIKKLVTWKQMAADIATDFYFERDNRNIKWARKLWLDPSIMKGK